MRAARLVGSALVIASVALGREARADVDEGVVVAGAIVGVGFGLADFGFLTYDIIQARDDVEPSEGAMIAGSVVTAPQFALGLLMMTFAQVDRDDAGPVVTLVALVPTAFVTGLLTFSAWSLEGSTLPLGTRLGVSMMIGANAALTIGATAASIVEPHYASPFLAVPELLVGAAQAAPSFVQAVRDPSHFGSWMALGIWSSAISVHGALSLVADAYRIGQPKYEGRATPTVARSSPPRATAPSWSFAPAMIRPPWSTDERGDAPGIVAAGTF